MNEIRYTVSFIVYKKGTKDFLVVKRPKEDKELGAIWGLPATGFDQKRETPEEAVIRGGREKLNCNILPVRRLPISMIQERDGYDLLMIDYECDLIGGVPDVDKANTKGTKYTQQQWVNNPDILIDGSKHGSACIQLFLFDRGIIRKEDFITDLKGLL